MLNSKTKHTLVELFLRPDPRLRSLQREYEEYLVTVDKWVESESVQGIKRAKDIFGWVLRFLMEQKPVPLPFIKVSSLGIPTIVRRLVWAAKSGSTETKVRLLTLLRVHDLYYGGLDKASIKDQLRIIDQSPKADPSLVQTIKSDLKTSLTKLVKKVPRFTIRESALSSWKSGPNGRYATMHALEDYVAIRAHGLQASITKLANEVASQAKGQSYTSSYPKWDDEEISESLQLREKGLTTQESLCETYRTGRLAFLGEKAGKVRLVAIGDYYSQTTLKPIHDFLMDILRKIPEDCTFDQQKGAEFLRKHTGNGSFLASYDHSSCTDLFPVEIQRDVLSELLGSSLAEAWLEVVTKRDFSYSLKDHNLDGTVRWSVGQPMGLYSSWPAMALAHHCLVYHAAKSAGLNPSDKYVILGDDIAISNPLLADSYLQLVKNLGMKINEVKSFVSGEDTPSCGEFAKRQFLSGIEYTPLPTALIGSAISDWRLAPLLVRKVRERVPLPLSDVARWVETTFPKQSGKLQSLLTKPSWLGGFALCSERPLLEELEGSDGGSPLFLRWLHKAIEKEQRDTRISSQKRDDYFGRICESWTIGVLREHPFVKLSGQQYPGQDRELGRRVDESLPLAEGRGLDPDGIANSVETYLRLREINSREYHSLGSSPLDVDKRQQRKAVNTWLKVLKQNKLFLQGDHLPLAKSLILEVQSVRHKVRYPQWISSREQLRQSISLAAETLKGALE